MRGKKKTILKSIFASLFLINMIFIMGTVTAEAAPAKVTGVKQISADEDSVEVTWNTVLGSDIRYVVEYSQDKKTWVEEHSYSSNEETIDDLNSGATYFVRVKAISDSYDASTAQQGAYSDIIEVVTAPDVTTETMVQSDATSSSVKVYWNAVPGATAYDVYYCCYSISPDNVYVGTVAATSAVIGNIPADQSYIVYVYPKRTAVTTGFTAADSLEYFSVRALTTPGKPDISVCDRDPRKKIGNKKNANYNTLEVQYTYGSNASGYEVYLYNAKGKKKKTIDNANNFGTSTTFKSVKTTDTVFVQVVPYILINGVKKYGDASDKIISIGAPTPKASKSGSGVKISWTKVPNAKKYEVYMSTSAQKGYKKIKTLKSNKTSFVLTKFKGKKLQRYQTYYYYVKAVGTYGGKKNAKSDIFYYNSFWFSSIRIY